MWISICELRATVSSWVKGKPKGTYLVGTFHEGGRLKPREFSISGPVLERWACCLRQSQTATRARQPAGTRRRRPKTSQVLVSRFLLEFVQVSQPRKCGLGCVHAGVLCFMVALLCHDVCCSSSHEAGPVVYASCSDMANFHGDLRCTSGAAGAQSDAWPISYQDSGP